MKSLKANLGLSICAVAGAIWNLSGTSWATTPNAEQAERLVRQALQAEMDGQPTMRSALLNEALKVAPDQPQANWHSGHVHIDGKWIPVAEAERQATENATLASYARLRDHSPNSAAGHWDLAVYCRKNGLKDREHLHGHHVLRLQPTNTAAIRALGLRKYRNCLLTEEQIQWYEGMLRQEREVRERWQPTLQRLRQSLQAEDATERETALAELRRIDAAEAVPLLEAAFGDADEALQAEVVAVVGRMRHPSATLSLLRWSVLPSSITVRQAAVDELKQRPIFSYVPILMGSLQTPVELSYYVRTLRQGLHIQLTFFREGPLADHCFRNSKTLVARFRPPPSPIHYYIIPLEYQRFLKKSWFVPTKAIARLGQTLDQTNSDAEAWNKRLFFVLKEATGQQFEDRPREWWNWWTEYNELASPEYKPIVESYTEELQTLTYSPYFRNPPSCFPARTPVWTETGPVPIEKIRLGDRVLSQNPESGELAYKLVIGTTVRPPSPILYLAADGTEIHATKGHLFWRVGDGWRMAKELQPGDRVHGISGAATVDQVEERSEVEAYNLIVDGFATYFVGQSRLLVHDNTARRALSARLPGLASE